MRIDKSRSVVQFSILDFVERTCVGLCNFLLDRAELLCCEHTGGNFSACDSSRNLLRVSSFVVCGSSVKQVSHSWHIVLDTCALYTFLNFINLFISLLNLYPDSELIIINIINKNLHSVYRSLEIHKCALTSSWQRTRQGTRYQSGTARRILWSASSKMC